MLGANFSVACQPKLLRLIYALCFTILLCSVTVRQARAAFLGDYALSKFIFSNSTFANGEAASPDGGMTLVLTGPHDGSGFGGTTDLTIAVPGAGLLHFAYLYACFDDPGFDFAGYLMNGAFYQFADADGQSGTIALPVVVGDVFGFRIESADNIGEPGILTVSDFSAPDGGSALLSPEPGALWLMCGAAALLWILKGARRLRRPSRFRQLLVAAAVVPAAAVPILAQAQADYAGTNVTGQVRLNGVVNLRQQAAALRMLGAAVPGAGEKKPKAPPPRLRPPTVRMLGAVSVKPAAAVAPVRSLTILPASGVLAFNALSHRDQRLAYSGNQFSVEPPSQSLAVGNGYILEGVNDAIQVYSSSGAPLLPTAVASNQLFGLAPQINWATGVNGVYTTDMRVYFDDGSGRWIILQRAQDNDVFGTPLNQSHLFLAVSKSPDPTGEYYVYSMDTTSPQHPGCPCVADYPQIGSDQFGFHVAWNNFSAPSFFFVDISLLSLSKASLASGAASPVAYQFFIPLLTGYEFSVQPATTPPGASNFIANGGVAYFASTLSRFAYTSGVAIWALRPTSSLATPNPGMILSRSVVSTLSYSFPDKATQRAGPLPYGSSLKPAGTLAFLDGGDPRVQTLSYAGGRLYLTFQTGVADEAGRSVVGGAYVVISPTFRSNVLAGSVLNQGYLVVNNNHLLRPALAVNAQGRGAIAVTLVGPDWYPSAAFIPFETFMTPSSLQVSGFGALPEDGFTGYPDGGGVGVARWGDYNGAVAAADGAIWTVAQYIGDYARTDFANWNTYITRKQP